MRNVIVLAAVVALAPLAAARLPEHEAPRATDLLRARRLAERAQRRLDMPTPRRHGWEPGGGWGDGRGGAREDETPAIRIEVRPPRGATRRRP